MATHETVKFDTAGQVRDWLDSLGNLETIYFEGALVLETATLTDGSEVQNILGIATEAA